MRVGVRALFLFALLSANPLPAPAATAPAASGTDRHPDIMLFVQLASTDRASAREADRALTAAWRDGYTPILLDLVRLMRPDPRDGSANTGNFDESTGGDGPGAGFLDDDEGGRLSSADGGATAAAADPGSAVRRRLIRFLEKRTGQRFGDDLDDWRRWIWSRPYDPHPDYASFKGGLYGTIDPRMREFFPPDVTSTIRLDQVDWGGVRVNGIPPLDHPAVVPADEAEYLKDQHVVFGIVVNGEARAYPRRVVAWHELVLDRVGGIELTLVYCTLCGAVIPYESAAGEATRYTFGTSGLLYRSNKLMFDHETKSLWSSVYGRPVVGPLAGSGIELTRRPVVTTRWEEWRRTHPATRVLSLDTGHVRDYREGAAYRDYLAHDRLMFAVDGEDPRLKRKDEVLTLALPDPLAIPVALLAERPVLELEHAGRRLLVLTSPAGASRVYAIGDERFDNWPGDETIVDLDGRTWRVTEDALIADDPAAASRPRLPASRAFWFAWYAHHPQTRLIR